MYHILPGSVVSSTVRGFALQQAHICLSVAEQNQAALGMRDVPGPPSAHSVCISSEPEEVALPKDKTISKDNTHRVGEVHNPVYAMKKIAALKRGKASNETISIQRSQMFR